MNLLLDTHAFLWFITNDPRLSSQAQSLIQVPANRRLLSMASLWEVAIKASLGKLTLAQPFDQFIPRQLQLNQIEVLVIELPHVAAVAAMNLPGSAIISISSGNRRLHSASMSLASFSNSGTCAS